MFYEIGELIYEKITKCCGELKENIVSQKKLKLGDLALN
jgi:hypothetical protein